MDISVDQCGSDDRYGSRLCENACAVLKSALLRKICQRLVNQQAENLRRNAIFAPVPAIKPAQKRFHTAWADFCPSRQAEIDVWSFTSGERTQNIKVHGALSCNDGEIAMNWALDGYGILQRSEWDLARYLRSGRLRLVLEDHTMRADIYAVYPQQLHLSARVRSLIDFLVEHFANMDSLADDAGQS